MSFASREGLALAELGGRARYLVEARADRDVEDALALSTARRLRLWALGGGSNVVVPDAGVDGIVLAMATHGVLSGLAIE